MSIDISIGQNLDEIVQQQATSKKTICIRIPFWLNSTSEPVSCWLHIPKNPRVSEMGMVVCNPLGYEYSHAHRTNRHLCDQVAAAGYASVRFDYHGTGDSFGDLFDSNRISTFIENIDHVVNFMKQQVGVKQICLTGIRLGATLAAEYTRNHPVEKLVLWAPSVKGKSYVREMKALEKLASHSDSVNKSDKEFIDSGGFIVTDETASNLSEINLLKQQYQVTEEILLIHRKDLKLDKKLFTTVSSNTEAKVTQYSMDGYLEMMAEPQQTVVPDATIQYIVGNLQKTTEKQEFAFTLNKASINNIAETSNSPFKEKQYTFSNPNIFGIFTFPKNGHQQNAPITLIVNSGSVHHVGPNRVYTELTREMASAGFSSLRIDLSNLGDSVQGKPKNENHPYPSNATNDITHICKQLQNDFGFKTILISGICSGVHNCFHAGLTMDDSINIQEFIFVNPLAFYRDPDGEFDLSASFKIERESQQYAESIFNLSKWKKLFTGSVDLKNLAGFILVKIGKIITSLILKVLSIFGLAKKTQLAKDLSQLVSYNRQVTFIIASKDPGKQILMAEAKNTIKTLTKNKKFTLYEVADADHTFSAFECRKSFKQIFISHLKKITTS